MRKMFHYGVTRTLARLLFFFTLCTFNAPPAGALYRPTPPNRKTQSLSPEVKAQREREQQARLKAAPADVEPIEPKELEGLRARGQYRNAGFSGVLPWQRSLRDVNLCNGNLFKSFTDLQVAPARGAGLAFQRTYNSNDERVGPFGIGWTHAYELRIEEAGSNVVPRTDFFGGKHAYHRDADGLYSPPPYMFDELSSEYENFLANGPAEVLEDTQKGMDGTIKHFVANGNARTCDYIEDRHGNRTEFTYGLSVGSTSLLTRVTDPSGRYLEITWDNLGTMMAPAYRIVEVAGPYDSTHTTPVYRVTYEYNGDLNLWKVHQDPSGLNRVTTYTYTTVDGESGLLASVSDPLGHTVSYTYSRVASNLVPFPTGTLWADSITEPTSGGTMTWDLAMGATNSYEFHVGAYNFTARVAVGVAVDFSLRTAALFNGPLWRQFDQYRFVYDSANNVTERREMLPSPYFQRKTTQATYGPHGNVLTQSQVGFSGTTTTTYYGGSKYFQKESVTDPEGNVTTFDYFANDDMSIGNRGEVKWVRDARYSVTGEQFEYTYNSHGQKLTETNLNNVVTEYTYADTWGNLTDVVQDPGGMGHLNRTTETEYDIAGRVVSSTDPKAQTSTFAYNGAGQPTTATLPGETVTYTYGGNGRTATVTDGRGTTEITYENGNDRVVSVEDPVTGTIAYTYRPAGERNTVTLPGGGTWTYTNLIQDLNFDETVLGQDDPNSIAPMVQTLEDDQGRVVEYTLDLFGALRKVRFNQTFDMGGNVVSYCETAYEFDEVMVSSQAYTHKWLTEIENTWHEKDPMTGMWSSQVLVGNAYTHDDNGNRLTNTLSDNSGPIRTETYGYDDLARLTSVNYGDGETQAYTFDPMGNRLTKVVNGVSEGYSYNAANMLLTRGGNSYTNDANGNTLTGGGRTNTWDAQNRLTQCVLNGTTTTHTYGCNGLRHRTVEGATTTDYVLDGQSVVRTLVNNVVDRTYLHGARGPEYERIGANDPLWYLCDGLGSVLGTVDENGSVVSTRKYDVYGAVRGSTGPGGTKHKYVGLLGHPSDDETGLIYARARYYDPATGTFVSEDPARDGSNWFQYANANPVNFYDQNGKRSETANLVLFSSGLALMCIGIYASRQGRILGAICVAFLAAWLNFDSIDGNQAGIGGTLVFAVGVLSNHIKGQTAEPPVDPTERVRKYGPGGIAQEVIGFYAVEAGFLEVVISLMD